MGPLPHRGGLRAALGSIPIGNLAEVVARLNLACVPERAMLGHSAVDSVACGLVVPRIGAPDTAVAGLFQLALNFDHQIFT